MVDFVLHIHELFLRLGDDVVAGTLSDQWIESTNVIKGKLLRNFDHSGKYRRS
jgi:hypothetical protein